MFVSVRIVDYGIASLLMFVSVPLSFLSMRFLVSQFPFTTFFFFRLDHNVE